MHDLMHDLALSVASETISHTKLDRTRNISEKTRHLLICGPILEGTNFPYFLLKLGKIRSVRFEVEPVLCSNKFLDTLLMTFTFLRFLELRSSEIEELPNSIGMLKNLRSLDLSNNAKLKRLPNNLCTLVNLQTISLFRCDMLQYLPKEFGNLCSLRSLVLSCHIKSFPAKAVADGLSSLQELWLFKCVHLESFLEGTQCFGGIRTLIIDDSPKLTSLTAETMRSLTSLEHLTISNCEKFSFSGEDSKKMELPRSLLSLVLINLPKLKELPTAIQGASASIKRIEILACNNFAILPEWLKKCTYLSKLQFAGCDENLEEDCQPETGKYFPFLSHIPQIDFTYDRVPYVKL